MPAFVIVRQSGKRGDTVDAVLCDPGALGYPDRKSSIPVKVEFVSERALSVDGEWREIISSTGINGVTTFLVDGSTRGLRNRDRRAALARASGFLQQLTSTLMPLRAESAEPELVAESLQMLFDWIARERERATTGADGVRR